MIGVTIRVEGAQELRAAIRRANDVGAKQGVLEANRAAVGMALGAVHAPVRSGRLQGSVKGRASQRSASLKTTLPYAGAIHWGRKQGNVGRPPGNHMGPNPIVGRPFLKEAIDSRAGAIAEKYKEEITRIIQQMIGR